MQLENRRKLHIRSHSKARVAAYANDDDTAGDGPNNEESKRRCQTDDLIGLSEVRRDQLTRSISRTIIDLSKKRPLRETGNFAALQDHNPEKLFKAEEVKSLGKDLGRASVP